MILGKLLFISGAITVHYIACDSTSEIYISSDGLVWTAITPSGVTASYIYCAYYDSGTWFLGTSNGLYYSTDGYTWTSHSTPLTSIYSITNDGTYYLIAGDGASYVIAQSSSMTGTFTGVTNAFTNNASWICANPTGTAFSTGSGSYTFLRRTIGVWYFTSEAFSALGNAVVWHVDKFIAVGEGGNTLAYSSSSGASWTGLGLDIFDTQGYAVASNGSYVVAGGMNSISPFYATAYSSDGVSWTGDSVSFNNPVTAIFWDGSRFLAVETGGRLKTSNNGLSWFGEYTIPTYGDIRSIYSDTL